MKKGNHILKSKEDGNFRVGYSTFAEDPAFGYSIAKTEYWERPPIWILQETSFAHLGWGFANFMHNALKDKIDDER